MLLLKIIDMFNTPYPRYLNEKEIDLFRRILPGSRPGYKIYSDHISEYYLVSRGNSENSFIMSKDSSFVNTVPFVTHVFAAGSFIFEEKEFNITVHEEIDESFEIEIITEPAAATTFDMIYSEWLPGMRAPGDNSYIREIPLAVEGHVLAFIPGHKKILYHVAETGVNHFVTSGYFYSSLCMIKKIRDPKLVLNPGLLFKNLDTYTNKELISAFHLYNKSAKRFPIDAPVEEKLPSKRGFFSKYFNKDNN